MAFCTKCGQKIDDNPKFCPACGAPFAPAAPAAQPETPVAQPAAPAAQPAAPAAQPAAPAAQPAAPAAQPAAAEQPAAKEKKKFDINEKFESFNKGADATADYDAADISKNKIAAVCAYLGILIVMPIFGRNWELFPAILLSAALLLVPLLLVKESKFARFHANQGSVLLIAAVAWVGVRALISWILSLIIALTSSIPVFGVIVWIVLGLINFVIKLTWVAFPAFAVIGIINVCEGKAKDLPILGKIRIFK